MLFWPCCCGGVEYGGTCCQLDYLGNPFGNLTWPVGWASEVCGGTRTYGDLLLQFPTATDPGSCSTLCAALASGIVFSQSGGGCLWETNVTVPSACGGTTYYIYGNLTITRVTGPPTRRSLIGGIAFGTSPFPTSPGWLINLTADSFDLVAGIAPVVTAGSPNFTACAVSPPPSPALLLAV